MNRWQTLAIFLLTIVIYSGVDITDERYNYGHSVLFVVINILLTQVIVSGFMWFVTGVAEAGSKEKKEIQFVICIAMIGTITSALVERILQSQGSLLLGTVALLCLSLLTILSFVSGVCVVVQLMTWKEKMCAGQHLYGQFSSLIVFFLFGIPTCILLNVYRLPFWELGILSTGSVAILLAWPKKTGGPIPQTKAV